MKYAVEMGSGAMIYLPNFMKTGSEFRKFLRGVYIDRKVISWPTFIFSK
jgi:hypothetical protein